MRPPVRRLLGRARRGTQTLLRPGHRPVGLGGARLPVQHFGMTRFSLFEPGSTGWRLTRRGDWDAEEYAAHLFSAERMGPRCEIFCELAAPLYQQMADEHRFRHLVLYSSVMPQRWKDRLREAARRHPVLWLLECGGEGAPPDLNGYLSEHLRRHSPGQDAMVFAFRVDDDDLLATDFLRQVEPHVVPQHHDHAVSFSSGFAALYENGRYTRAVPWHQPLSSMGQGAVGTWRAQEDRLALTLIGSHHRTDHRRVVLLDGRRPTFLQTRHVGQDTAVRKSGPSDLEQSRARIVKELGRQSCVSNPDVLLKRFPTLVGRIELDEVPTQAGPRSQVAK